jgi:hypothetical protein
MIHPQPTIMLMRASESRRRPRYGDEAVVMRRSASVTLPLVRAVRTMARRRRIRALPRPLERY